MGAQAAISQESNLNPNEAKERAIYRRAIEAVIWGMPIVNFDLMYQEMVRIRGKFNQIVYWSRLLDWKNQTLTPNPDVIYVMPFINTEDGPMVLEIPPADNGVINGSIMDCWQTALEDVGPAGLDDGKGGRYLILPPEYKGSVPEGYFIIKSITFRNYALLRSILNSGNESDVTKAISYTQRIKLYPLFQAANPLPTIFLDAANELFDSTIPYNIHFFISLDRMVKNENWLTRDKVMIDVLKTIGIEKGKPFNPDNKTKEILERAVLDARAELEIRYDAIFSSPFYEGTRWAFPASKEVVEGLKSNYTLPNEYPIDGRGLTYSFAFFSAKNFGQGQFYLMSIKDKENIPFIGSNTYRLRVPANVPVNQYWSATVYDRKTHAFILNTTRTGRSSQSQGIQKNSDGSVDIYFGPKAPEGKVSNWIPTNTTNGFEVMFRLYGPEKSFFEKKWKLQDIERIG